MLEVVGKKTIIFGMGKISSRIFNIFPQLIKYVDFFVDSFSSEKFFNEIPVKKPDIFEENNNSEYIVIISASSERIFYEIYGLLVKKYGLLNEQIFSIREWLICMLKNHEDIMLRPTSVRLEASTICQLNCTGCYMRKGDYGTVGKGTLSFAHFKSFVDKNDYIKEIEISNNGEALLNPELIDILEYAYKRGIRINIGSGANFNTVSDELIEALVKYNVQNIRVSIDGASQDVYATYRRNGNFSRVIENIRKINKVKEDYNSLTPILNWQYILMEHNEEDVELAIKMSKELNMRIIFKLDWSNHGYMPKNPEKMQKLTGMKFFDRNEYKKGVSKNYNSNICRDLLFSPQINWDGRLLGCCGVFQNDWGMNVFSEGFLECINSEKYRKTIICFLGDTSEATNEKTPCSDCKNYLDCLLNQKYICL